MKVFGDEMSHFSAQTDKDKKNGNIESACTLSKNYMDTASCQSTLSNHLAIAIVNSQMYHRRQRRNVKTDVWNPEYPCITQFPHRMVIGTHEVDRKDMAYFQSTDAESYYVSTLDYAINVH